MLFRDYHEIRDVSRRFRLHLWNVRWFPSETAPYHFYISRRFGEYVEIINKILRDENIYGKETSGAKGNTVRLP